MTRYCSSFHLHIHKRIKYPIAGHRIALTACIFSKQLCITMFWRVFYVSYVQDILAPWYLTLTSRVVLRIIGTLHTDHSMHGFAFLGESLLVSQLSPSSNHGFFRGAVLDLRCPLPAGLTNDWTAPRHCRLRHCCAIRDTQFALKSSLVAFSESTLKQRVNFCSSQGNVLHWLYPQNWFAIPLNVVGISLDSLVHVCRACGRHFHAVFAYIFFGYKPVSDISYYCCFPAYFSSKLSPQRLGARPSIFWGKLTCLRF